MVARQRTCQCGTRPRWCVRTWPLVGKSQWFKLVFVGVHGHLATVRVRSTDSHGEWWCSDDDFSHGHGGGLCWSQASLLYLVEQGTGDERLCIPGATARVHETASPTTGGVAGEGTRLAPVACWSSARSSLGLESVVRVASATAAPKATGVQGPDDMASAYRCYWTCVRDGG